MLRYTERLLQRDERPQSTYDYYVSGRGPFPYDMLRHDRCWPCSSTDAVEMARNGRDAHRSIHVRSYQQPTEGRWSSFLWSVGKDTV